MLREKDIEEIAWEFVDTFIDRGVVLSLLRWENGNLIFNGDEKSWDKLVSYARKKILDKYNLYPDELEMVDELFDSFCFEQVRQEV